MTDNLSSQEILRQLGPGWRSVSSEARSRRSELTRELHKYVHVMGPTPKRCLETLVDLGLSDPEIAHYFKIPKGVVTHLRQVWKIGCET